MQPALSQVCSLHSRFEQDVEDFAAGQCRAIDIWLTKLEEYVKRNSVAAAKALLAEHGVVPVSGSFQGGLLASQGESRRAAWELFEQRLDLCRAVGIPLLVIAGDIPPPLDQATIERVQVSLQQAAQAAGRRGLRVALEFQARAAFGNNLQTAAALVAEVGSPHLGLCLDLFHFYVGPSKTEDLGLIGPHNLFLVQLSDLADTPREFAADADRILPGEGDIPLQPLIEHLRTIRYQGPVTIELLNPQIWQVPPRQFGEIGLTALRMILGQAEKA